MMMIMMYFVIDDLMIGGTLRSRICTVGREVRVIESDMERLA